MVLEENLPGSVLGDYTDSHLDCSDRRSESRAGTVLKSTCVWVSAACSLRTSLFPADVLMADSKSGGCSYRWAEIKKDALGLGRTQSCGCSKG